MASADRRTPHAPLPKSPHPPERYERLARTLLAADDPVMAIAGQIGDHAGLFDAHLRLIGQLEARIDLLELKEARRG